MEIDIITCYDMKKPVEFFMQVQSFALKQKRENSNSICSCGQRSKKLLHFILFQLMEPGFEWFFF